MSSRQSFSHEIKKFFLALQLKYLRNYYECIYVLPKIDLFYGERYTVRYIYALMCIGSDNLTTPIAFCRNFIGLCRIGHIYKC